MNRKLEICCYTVESALKAEKAGADRIELCDNYSEGGTTPSWATIKYAVDNLNIPVNVIVRPRGGDFLYSAAEYEVIKNDVIKAAELNANGVVTGFLKTDGSIDIQRTEEIIKLAGQKEVTFHRAFDMCANPVEALKELIDLGVTRILTSGCKYKAIEGADLISELIESAGGKIIIMPGGGINENNIKELVERTNAFEYHASMRAFERSTMKYINPGIKMGGLDFEDEQKIISVNSAGIRNMKAILNSVV